MKHDNKRIKTITLEDIASITNLNIDEQCESFGIIMSPFELNREDFHKITENMGDNLFRLKEARILFLKKGSMRNLLNFEEYEIQERTLAIFPPNFNIENTNISTDFSAEIIALKETFFESEDMIKLFRNRLFTENVTVKSERKRCGLNYFVKHKKRQHKKHRLHKMFEIMFCVVSDA